MSTGLCVPVETLRGHPQLRSASGLQNADISRTLAFHGPQAHALYRWVQAYAFGRQLKTYLYQQNEHNQAHILHRASSLFETSTATDWAPLWRVCGPHATYKFHNLLINSRKTHLPTDSFFWIWYVAIIGQCPQQVCYRSVYAFKKHSVTRAPLKTGKKSVVNR